MRPRPSISALMVPLPMMPRSRLHCCGCERMRRPLFCASCSEAICSEVSGLAGFALSLSTLAGFDLARFDGADFEDVDFDLACFDLLEDFAALATTDSLWRMEKSTVRPELPKG